MSWKLFNFSFSDELNSEKLDLPQARHDSRPACAFHHDNSRKISTIFAKTKKARYLLWTSWITIMTLALTSSLCFAKSEQNDDAKRSSSVDSVVEQKSSSRQESSTLTKLAPAIAWLKSGTFSIGTSAGRILQVERYSDQSLGRYIGLDFSYDLELEKIGSFGLALNSSYSIDDYNRKTYADPPSQFQLSSLSGSFRRELFSRDLTYNYRLSTGMSASFAKALSENAEKQNNWGSYSISASTSLVRQVSKLLKASYSLSPYFSKKINEYTHNQQGSANLDYSLGINNSLSLSAYKKYSLSYSFGLTQSEYYDDFETSYTYGMNLAMGIQANEHSSFSLSMGRSANQIENDHLAAYALTKPGETSVAFSSDYIF